MNVLGTILSASTPSLTGLGISTLSLGSWSVGILEPAVAVYALRLYRNLGARVGFWLFTSFCLLALAHLLQSWGGTAKVFAPAVSFDLLAVLVPLLLLIGMAHTESILVDRIRVERKEQKLRLQSECEAEEKIAALVEEKETLRGWVARCQEREKSLEQSAQQYHVLFTDNPQPMWLFDLRSLRLLEVNKAALALYGFTSEEFLAKAAPDLLQPTQAESFRADAARPAPHGQSRGVWRNCRKDGTPFGVQLRVIDLSYADSPARLVLASAIADPHQPAAPVS